MSISRTFTLLALLAACGGGDEVVSDASPVDAASTDAATVDAALVDGAPPDGPGPSILIGDVVEHAHVVAGPALALTSVVDVAWDGTDFVVAGADGIAARIGLDTTFRGSMRTGEETSVYSPHLTCRTDGACAAVWRTLGFTARAAVLGGPFPEPFTLPIVDVIGEPSIAAWEDRLLVLVPTFGAWAAIEVWPDGTVSPTPIILDDVFGAPVRDAHASAGRLAVETGTLGDSAIRVASLDGALGAPIPWLGTIGAFHCAAGTTTCVIAGTWGTEIRAALITDAPGFLPLSIATAVASEPELHLSADDTGYVLTVGEATSSSGEVPLRGHRIDLAGSVGPGFDIIATADQRRTAIGCSPAGCVVASSYADDVRAARLVGTELLDPIPFTPTAADSQRVPRVARTATGAVVTYADRRLPGTTFAVASSLDPVAAWSAPVTLATAGSPFAAWTGAENVYAWTTAGGVGIQRGVDVPASHAATGAVTGIACHPTRCLVSTGRRGFVVDESSAIVAGSSYDLGAQLAYAGEPIAFTLATGEPGFALPWAYSDGHIMLTPFSADGAPLTAIDLGAGVVTPYVLPNALVIDDTIAVQWLVGGTNRVRTVGSDLTLGPVHDLAMKGRLELARFGDHLLLAGLEDGRRVVVQRFSTMIEPIDLAPIVVTPELAYPNVPWAIGGAPDALYVVWSQVDPSPSRGVERLSAVLLRPAP